MDLPTHKGGLNMNKCFELGPAQLNQLIKLRKLINYEEKRHRELKRREWRKGERGDWFAKAAIDCKQTTRSRSEITTFKPLNYGGA